MATAVISLAPSNGEPMRMKVEQNREFKHECSLMLLCKFRYHVTVAVSAIGLKSIETVSISGTSFRVSENVQNGDTITVEGSWTLPQHALATMDKKREVMSVEIGVVFHDGRKQTLTSSLQGKYYMGSVGSDKSVTGLNSVTLNFDLGTGHGFGVPHYDAGEGRIRAASTTSNRNSMGVSPLPHRSSLGASSIPTIAGPPKSPGLMPVSPAMTMGSSPRAAPASPMMASLSLSTSPAPMSLSTSPGGFIHSPAASPGALRSQAPASPMVAPAAFGGDLIPGLAPPPTHH
eukprot:Opistho-2@34651